MTTKFILNEIGPAFSVLSGMQQNGTLRIGGKVAYALGKNYSKIKRVAKAQQAFRDDLIQEYVHFEEGRPKTVEVEGKNPEWDFKSPELKKEFLKKMNNFMDDDITMEGGWHKISEEDLKEIDNFPMDVFAAFEEAGILTPMLIAGNGLKLVN